jgi:hypothetical protein
MKTNALTDSIVVGLSILERQSIIETIDSVAGSREPRARDEEPMLPGCP